MYTKSLLWLTVIISCFHFGGHLFDMLANQPNWKSGEIMDVLKYRDFYALSSPKNFFIILVMGGPLINLLALVSVWKLGKRLRGYIGLSFLITLVVMILTVSFFVPINDYIFNTEELDLDAGKLIILVNDWISMEKLRVLLLGLGMLFSILGINSYYENKSVTV